MPTQQANKADLFCHEKKQPRIKTALTDELGPFSLKGQLAAPVGTDGSLLLPKDAAVALPPNTVLSLWGDRLGLSHRLLGGTQQGLMLSQLLHL